MSEPVESDARPAARVAIAVAGAVLVLGLAAGAFHELGGFGVEGDFYAGYAPAARAMARGEWPELPRSGPGYPALLAALAWISDDLFAIAKVLAACSVALTCWLAYRVVARATDARTGLLVEVLLGVALFRYTFTVGNDLVFVALTSASLFFLLQRERPTRTDMLLAGVCAGLATITRYPGMALVAAALAGILWMHPARERGAVRALHASLFLAGALLTSSPWWLANVVRHGNPLHNQGHALVALQVHGAASEQLSSQALAQMDERFTSLGEVFAADPARFVQALAFDALADANQMLADVLVLPASLFLGAGLLLLFIPGRARRRRVAILCLYALLGFACFAVVPYQERYSYSILPVLLMPVAFVLLAPLGPQDALARRVQCIALAAVVAMFAATSVLKTHKWLASEPLEVLSAARALRAQEEQGLLAARKPHLGFLADRAHVLPGPAGDLEGFRAWLDAQGVRWLYVGPAEVSVQPALAPLARGELVLPRITLLDRVAEPPACLYRVD